jgi:CheY-like chemotaxis protein/DNA-directed RNA polymerase specialized sigma24 family protein
MCTYQRQLYEHLPFLRRYARALTGATEQGDALVVGCIEVASMAPRRFGVSGGSRAALYALLNLLFDRKGEGRPHRTDHPVERALARLRERDRRLYLLTALEDLPLAQAARVVGLDVDGARAVLARTRDALRSALTARVLVVEDNAVAAMDLAGTIVDMGHEVCGPAATGREALALAQAENPTLALMDIRLACGENGIAVAQKLRDMFGLPVIFVTGSPGELDRLGIGHMGPVVAKPFTAEAVRRAIAGAVFSPRPAGPPPATRH